ncbi:MAG: NAD(+)/NADH kinase [Peptostreptococcaceae bacterium]
MKHISITSNEVKKSVETKKILKDKLQKEGFEVYDEINENCDFIICIGGDGWFLKTAHDIDFKRIPIIAVNTGHLGFFAEVEGDELDYFVNYLKNDEFIIQTIDLIKTTIYANNEVTVINSVNEIVIKNICSRTVHLDISVDNRKIQSFSGDAILVSTPMGSTAYNYSAGGSIVDPSLDIIQLTPIAPMNTIAYRSFTSSVILANTSKIKICPENEFENSILVVADGIEHDFNEIEKIVIEKSCKNIDIYRMKDYDFFRRVCKKFL